MVDGQTHAPGSRGRKRWLPGIHEVTQRVVGIIGQPEQKARCARRGRTDLEQQRVPALLQFERGTVRPGVSQIDKRWMRMVLELELAVEPELRAIGYRQRRRKPGSRPEPRRS